MAKIRSGGQNPDICHLFGFLRHLGLPASTTELQVPSPFDYPENGLLYVPEMAERNDPAAEQQQAAATRIQAAARGRAARKARRAQVQKRREVETKRAADKHEGSAVTIQRVYRGSRDRKRLQGTLLSFITQPQANIDDKCSFSYVSS